MSTATLETVAPIFRSYEAVIDEVRNNERAIIAKINTGDVDRYRTVISPHGIDLSAYRSNPVVLHEHGQDPRRGTLPIGRNEWIRIDGKGRGSLIAKTIFRNDEYSSILYDAYASGEMRGWSVRVLPKDFSPPNPDEIRAWPELARDCSIVYRTGELLEYSSTAIPGNNKCLSMLVSRGFWVPPEAKAILEGRAMTESNGLSTGGALVKPSMVGEGKPKGKSQVLMPSATATETVIDPDEETGDEDHSQDETFELAEDGTMITPEEFSGDPSKEFRPNSGQVDPEEEECDVSTRAIDTEDQTNEDIRPAEEEPDDGSTTPVPPRQDKMPQAPGSPKSRFGTPGPGQPGIRPSPKLDQGERTIKNEGGKWVVYSEKGKRLSKPYASKAQAAKRLREIEYFKHQDRAYDYPIGVKPDASVGPRPAPDPRVEDKPKESPKSSTSREFKGKKLYVRKRKGEWIVVGDTGKVHGKFESREDALKQIGAIQHELKQDYDKKHGKKPIPDKRSSPRRDLDMSPNGYRIDSDGTSWFVRRADGHLIVAYPDVKLANDFIAAQKRGSFDFASGHVRTINELRTTATQLEKKLIGQAEFWLLGKVPCKD